MRNAKPEDVPFIEHLHKLNSDQLGFIPTAGILAYAQLGQVAIAEYNATEAGYLLFAPRAKEQTNALLIHQACVSYDLRNQDLGTALVNRVCEVGRRSGSAVAQLWCRCDIDANRFWLHAGFEPIAAKPGGAARGLPLIGWRRAIIKGSSLSLPVSNRNRSEAGNGRLFLHDEITDAAKSAIAAGDIPRVEAILRRVLR